MVTAMNKTVVRKMIKRLESVPESYQQSALFVEENDGTPCGTVACLGGEAVICSAKTIKAGIKLALDSGTDVVILAEEVLGLTSVTHSVFSMDASGWPVPYYDNFRKAGSRKAETQVGSSLPKGSLKTRHDGLVGQRHATHQLKPGE